MIEPPTNVFVWSGRPLARALVAALILVVWGHAATLPRGAAAPIQVAGNLAFLPNQSGELTVAQLDGGTNTTLLSTYPFIKDIGGISLHGRYAFVSVTNESLIVFDVATLPPAYLEGARFLTPGAALDVKVVGDTAYLADGAAGIVVLDVFEPTGMMEIVRLEPPGNVSSLDISSNRLYAACGSGGLRIYDLTYLGAPQTLGNRNTASAARRVRVGGNLAFVTCTGGRLEIINVQNPAAPTLASSYLGGGALQDVDVAGSFAVLANSNGALTVLNVSNPAAPVPVSTNTIAGGAYGVRINGGHAYVRNGAGSLIVVPLPSLPATAPQLQEAVRPVLVAAGQTAVMSVIAAGTPPVSLQWSKNGVPLTNDVRITGTTNSWLVIANSVQADAGTYSVTVSNALGQLVSSNALTVVNPGAPVVRGSFDPGGTAQDVDATGFRAYVAAGTNGLEIFDVINPRYPLRTGGAEVSGFSSGIRVLGEFAERVFMATDTNGLQVFNVFPFEPPVLISATNTTGNTRAIFLAGGLIYVADGSSGIQVFSLGNSDQPTFLGAYDTPGFAWNVFVAEGIAYVADGTNGIQLLSVTNPAAIQFLGSYDTPGEARNVKVSASTACVADGSGGVILLDVSNPANPVPLGSYTNAAPALDLECADDIVVVAKGANGVETLDVANPVAIVSLGSTLAAAPANAVRLEGSTVYVAAGSNGVIILELVGLNVGYPEITLAPFDVVTLPGGNVSFHVAATGAAPLRYQWFHQGVALADNATTAGSATATLSLSNLELSASGDYVVEVRNAWNLPVSALVNLEVVPVGTPVFRSGYFDPGDVLSTHVVGQVAFVASRTNGLLAIDCRDPLNPVLVGQHPTLDLAQDVEVHGRYAYVASWQAGLEIFDVLNPTNLVRVGQCDTPGRAREVRIDGQRALVADRNGANGIGGIAIIDVSDPTRPGLIGTAGTGGFAEGLDFIGNMVFVAASDAGLAVLDAANPLAPVQIGQLNTPGNAEGLLVSGGKAYLSDYNRGFRIVDVNNPATPVSLGEFATTGDAFQMQVVSNRAYVATGIGRVQVVDVSNASQPNLISTSLAGNAVHQLQVIGQHAFLADRESGLLVAELLGFDPSAPSVVEFATNLSQTVGSELVLSVAAEGTPPLDYTWRLNGAPLTNSANVSGVKEPHLRFASLALSNNGSYTVVISNAQGSVTSAVATVTATSYGAPLARGVFHTPGTVVASAVHGNVAFVADGGNVLQLADWQDLDHPVALGAYSATGTVYGVCVQSNLLYLALGSAGIEIVDLSDPQQPAHVSVFDTPGTAFNLDVHGGLAFVADGAAGLQVLNVSDPANPSALGALDTTGTARDVRVVGNLAFVADGNEGLQVITVTNPAAPVRIGGYVGNGEANAVRVSNNRAYIADTGDGLLLLDISSPASPSFLGTYPADQVTSLDVIGNLVVLANGSGGYLVLDATNPALLVPVGGGTTDDAVTAVLLVGNLAFMASGLDGLELVQLSGVPPLVPAFLRQPKNVSVLHGDTAQFEALPTGAPALTYRWYLDGLPVFDNGRISGAATTQLTLTNVTLQDAGNYTLRTLSPWGVTNSIAAVLRFIGPLQAQIDSAATGAVIQLPPGTYQETLWLDKDVTLTGQWWNPPVLNSAGQGTVLHVLPGVNVTLRGLVLRNGAAFSGNGGGLLNEGNLWLDHCLVADNAAASGAGIANLGTLVMVSSVLSNNTATSSGGGIHNAAGGIVLVTNSTITANLAQDGAGVFNRGAATLVGSLVSSNLAHGLLGNGGGFRCSTGLLQVVNTTISGNQAVPAAVLPLTGLGGGVCVDAGVVEFQSSTVAFNTASLHGGGISIAAVAQVLSGNSIFADNVSPDSPDYGGVMYSDGHNLVENPVGLAPAGPAPSDLVGQDARLGPLRDNGGPTLTHALSSNSPAIDAAAFPAPATDARGLVRPFDLPWIANAAQGLDIGAFEYIDPSPYLILSNRTAAGFTLAWGTNSVLQQKPSLDVSWLDTTNASPLFVSTLANEQHFFRLRSQVLPAVLTTNNQTTNGFILSWPGVAILEHAPAATGPWESLSGASPYPVTITPGENEFFRLRVIEH